MTEGTYGGVKISEIDMVATAVWRDPAIPSPAIGDIVHYRLPTNSARAGERRAAIVTNVIGGDTVNLTMFVDQDNDLRRPGYAGAKSRPLERVESVIWGKDPGNWCWPTGA